MEHSPRQTRDYLVLLGILALALVLRIIGLNAPLWYDEILTVQTHLHLPWSDMLQGYSMNNHYLFNLQSKLAMDIFGEDIWAIRLPAMLFGVASIGALWWLARDIAGSTIAHLSALLLAISYHHIWFSQNARGYSELAFFSTLGMVLFLRAMARPRPTIWVLYGITLALAVFTHLTGAFLFAAQGVVWLGYAIFGSLRGSLSQGQIKWPLVGYTIGAALTILLYLPLLPSLLDTVGGVSGGSSIDVMQEYQNPLWSLLEGVRTAIGATGPLVGLVALVVIILSTLGGIASRKIAPLFGPLVALHIALTLALLLVLGMRIWPRFFFADIGFVMLLIVLGVRLSCGWFGRFARPLFTAASIAMVLISAALASRNYMAPKQNLRGAFDYVQTLRGDDIRVFAVGQASIIFNGYLGANWGEIHTNQDYQAANATPGPALYVVAFPARSLRKVSDLDTDTETRLTLLRRFPGTLGDGAILIFRRD